MLNATLHLLPLAHYLFGFAKNESPLVSSDSRPPAMATPTLDIFILPQLFLLLAPCSLPIGLLLRLLSTYEDIEHILTQYHVSPALPATLAMLRPLLMEWLAAVASAPDVFQIPMHLYTFWSSLIPNLASGSSLTPSRARALEGLLLLKDIFALMLHVDYLLPSFSTSLTGRFLTSLHHAALDIRAHPLLALSSALATCIPNIFYLRPPTIQSWLCSYGLWGFRTPPLAPLYATFLCMNLDPADLKPFPLETIEEAKERNAQLNTSTNGTPETAFAYKRRQQLSQLPPTAPKFPGTHLLGQSTASIEPVPSVPPPASPPSLTHPSYIAPQLPPLDRHDYSATNIRFKRHSTDLFPSQAQKRLTPHFDPGKQRLTGPTVFRQGNLFSSLRPKT